MCSVLSIIFFFWYCIHKSIKQKWTRLEMYEFIILWPILGAYGKLTGTEQDYSLFPSSF